MRLIATLIVGSSALIGWAAPQTPSTQNPKPDAKRLEGAGNPGAVEATQADRFLASWLLVTSKNELELATMAQQKATDPAVKALAQKVMDDHRLFITKLQPYAGSTGSTLKGSTGSTGGRQDDPNRGDGRQDDPLRGDGRQDPNRGEGQDEPSRGQPTPASFGQDKEFNHESLFQELGAKCLQTARKELDQKQGAEFDKCYTTMVVGSHTLASDMLSVFQQHSSAPFKAVLSEGQKTVASHLQMAKAHADKAQSGAPIGNR